MNSEGLMFHKKHQPFSILQVKKRGDNLKPDDAQEREIKRLKRPCGELDP